MTDASPRIVRWGRRLLAVYALLLVLSHGVRLAQGRFEEPPPPPDSAVSELQAFAVEEVEVEDVEVEDTSIRGTGRRIQLAYRQWPADPGELPATAPILLAVHGSPGDAANFSRLAPLLVARGLRVVAPDLPGFGASSQQIADYSIRAHAEYCRRLLGHLRSELGAQRIHALGFSLGGGVVVHLAALEPRRVESVILLAATGVQDLELLGNYSINHAIHAAQLAFFLGVQELVPHFGLLDSSHAHLSYARNFYDTDQRPLRGLLEGYSRPMLILHGRDDFLVPYAAALEHHRIVPQSVLVTFESGHFLPFSDPEILQAPIADFVRDVEDGRAVTRDGAPEDRLAMARDGERQSLPRATGPTLLVWIALLMVATLVSEDLTCLAAGLLVARGSLGFWPAVFGCGAGIFLGDLGLYLLGRLGRPFLGRAPLRWMLDAEDLKRSESWFERRGALVILFSRFLPGTRVPTYVSAGLLAMNPFTFALYLLLPVALWTPLLVALSFAAGERMLGLFESFETWAAPAFIGSLLVLWALLLFGRRLLTWKGRRRLVGAWRRWTRWEFWPRWLFYPPVVVYVLGLALRHRSLTLFTAANPGIPAGGGFVGESKSTILRRLDSRHVAPWRPLDPGPLDRRRREVESFLEGPAASAGGRDFEGGYPVVLKPDVGERGDGVTIARGPGDVEDFLRREPGPAILQCFVSGPELGVFWLLPPGEEKGIIFSITDKRLPRVVGDGVSTLRRLVFADPRAVALADVYLERLGERAGEVPAAGEEVHLVDLGTHCRGAVFLDGETYRSPELEAKVEEIARGYEGFHFGRFDLRAPSYEHFRRGEGITVLEVNGVTSEATHIYDPELTLLGAWRTLARQWRWAYAIGRANREHGHEPLGVRGALRLLREYRER